MKQLLRQLLLVTGLLVFWAGCASSGQPSEEEPGATETMETRGATELIDEAAHTLHEAKEKLEEERKYLCCIQEPHCDWCALKYKECACGPNLGVGDPVCPDCVQGWRDGKGNLKGVNPDDVRSILDKKEL